VLECGKALVHDDAAVNDPHAHSSDELDAFAARAPGGAGRR